MHIALLSYGFVQTHFFSKCNILVLILKLPSAMNIKTDFSMNHSSSIMISILWEKEKENDAFLPDI